MNNQRPDFTILVIFEHALSNIMHVFAAGITAFLQL